MAYEKRLKCLGLFLLLIRCFCRSNILLRLFSFFSGNISCVIVFVLLVCSIDNESIFYIYPDATQ